METLKQQLKTFEDACRIEGLNAEIFDLTLLGFPEEDKQPLTAIAKLLVIARAANKIANNGEKWTPDWNDDEQYKYWPWFWMDDEGGSSGFRFDVYAYWDSYSTLGSRLCFISSEVAEYIGEQFIDLYKQFMVIE